MELITLQEIANRLGISHQGLTSYRKRSDMKYLFKKYDREKENGYLYDYTLFKNEYIKQYDVYLDFLMYKDRLIENKELRFFCVKIYKEVNFKNEYSLTSYIRLIKNKRCNYFSYKTLNLMKVFNKNAKIYLFGDT